MIHRVRLWSATFVVALFLCSSACASFAGIFDKACGACRGAASFVSGCTRTSCSYARKFPGRTAAATATVLAGLYVLRRLWGAGDVGGAYRGRPSRPGPSVSPVAPVVPQEVPRVRRRALSCPSGSFATQHVDPRAMGSSVDQPSVSADPVPCVSRRVSPSPSPSGTEQSVAVVRDEGGFTDSPATVSHVESEPRVSDVAVDSVLGERSDGKDMHSSTCVDVSREFRRVSSVENSARFSFLHEQIQNNLRGLARNLACLRSRLQRSQRYQIAAGGQRCGARRGKALCEPRVADASLAVPSVVCSQVVPVSSIAPGDGICRIPPVDCVDCNDSRDLGVEHPPVAQRSNVTDAPMGSIAPGDGVDQISPVGCNDSRDVIVEYPPVAQRSNVTDAPRDSEQPTHCMDVVEPCLELQPVMGVSVVGPCVTCPAVDCVDCNDSRDLGVEHPPVAQRSNVTDAPRDSEQPTHCMDVVEPCLELQPVMGVSVVGPCVTCPDAGVIGSPFGDGAVVPSGAVVFPALPVVASSGSWRLSALPVRAFVGVRRLAPVVRSFVDPVVSFFSARAPVSWVFRTASVRDVSQLSAQPRDDDDVPLVRNHRVARSLCGSADSSRESSERRIVASDVSKMMTEVSVPVNARIARTAACCGDISANRSIRGDVPLGMPSRFVRVPFVVSGLYCDRHFSIPGVITVPVDCPRQRCLNGDGAGSGVDSNLCSLSHAPGTFPLLFVPTLGSVRVVPEVRPSFIADGVSHGGGRSATRFVCDDAGAMDSAGVDPSCGGDHRITIVRGPLMISSVGHSSDARVGVLGDSPVVLAVSGARDDEQRDEVGRVSPRVSTAAEHAPSLPGRIWSVAGASWGAARSAARFAYARVPRLWPSSRTREREGAV